MSLAGDGGGLGLDGLLLGIAANRSLEGDLALPRDVLAYPCFDIVLLNEGVYALHDLLRGNLASDLAKTKGIGYKQQGPGGQTIPVLNPPQCVVPQERMDADLPGYAWDLLPYKEKVILTPAREKFSREYKWPRSRGARCKRN